MAADDRQALAARLDQAELWSNEWSDALDALDRHDEASDVG